MFLQKKSLRITTAILLIVALALCGLIVYWCVFSPEAQVRRDLLKAMPFGSVENEGLHNLQESGWRFVSTQIVDLSPDGKQHVIMGVLTDATVEEAQNNDAPNTYRVYWTFKEGGLYDVEVDAIDLDSVTPLHRTPKSIKAWVKKKLPVGSDKAAVRAWLLTQTELDIDERDGGYFLSEDYTLTEEERREGGLVGVTRICASTSYQYLFVTHVDIFFGFDENDRLVDVGVRSDTDSF